MTGCIEQLYDCSMHPVICYAHKNRTFDTHLFVGFSRMLDAGLEKLTNSLFYSIVCHQKHIEELSYVAGTCTTLRLLWLAYSP